MGHGMYGHAIPRVTCSASVAAKRPTGPHVTFVFDSMWPLISQLHYGEILVVDSTQPIPMAVHNLGCM